MTQGRCLLLLAAVCVLVGTLGAGAGERGDLTPEALAAVKTLYPNANIVAVSSERERGVTYFEVAVRDGDQRVEIEVTADGTIGEIEREMSVADAPAAVREGIDSLSRGGAAAKVERHEIHGVARGGGFEALDAPIVAYEVEYEAHGRRVEITLDENGSPLALGGPADDDSSDSSDSDSSDDSDSDDSDSDDSDGDDSDGDDSDGDG